MSDLPAALLWLRRDLRLEDNAALHAALRASRKVWCVFVFDTDILGLLPSRRDRRVEFIRESLVEVNAALAERGSGLIVLHGRPQEEIPRLASTLRASAVFVNHDYEPAAVERDAQVAKILRPLGVELRSRKDHVVFEKDEVLTADARPYSVFTPYRNAWLKRLRPFFLKAYPSTEYLDRLAPMPRVQVPELAGIGFEKTNLGLIGIPTGVSGARRLLDDFVTRIDDYRKRRDYPSVRGPSYLSVHLRFGTISIRELARIAHARDNEGAQTWLSELVWRDFYFMILHHHPHVVRQAFKPDLDAIAYPDDPEKLAAWCEARTGYPLVDAAMRQLNQSGYMHNRLRMVTASFLVKDLHVDWRCGERYFADQLNDFDLSANNGGWQWAASTGCDAQPWFRIFNPVTQSEKFDPEGRFIRKYLPELAKVPAHLVHAPWKMDADEQRKAGVVIGRDYPAPVVDHAEARKITLDLYGRAAKGAARATGAGQ